MPTGVYKRTPEACAANSQGHTGVKLSPEHCAAVSEGIRNSEAVKARDDAMRGVPHTPERCAAMSVAHTGVPLSPKHIAAAIKGQVEAGVYDKMRGGNDICNHHIAYDFGMPESLTVKITRSFHGQIHHPKGCQFGTYGYSLID